MVNASMEEQCAMYPLIEWIFGFPSMRDNLPNFKPHVHRHPPRGTRLEEVGSRNDFLG